MKCVETYDNKQFWITDDEADNLKKVILLANPPKIVEIGNSLITVNNISGIFDELDMREKEYRKQGMYVCDFMRWHNFKEICHCRENFIKYGIFENQSSDIKSKQLLDYEKKNGKLELNLDENFMPKVSRTHIGTIKLKDENIS